jgi:hypothetical protein
LARQAFGCLGLALAAAGPAQGKSRRSRSPSPVTGTSTGRLSAQPGARSVRRPQTGRYRGRQRRWPGLSTHRGLGVPAMCSHRLDPGVGQPSGLRVVHLVRRGAGRPPPRQGRAHIDGGAARLTEARVSIMQRKTKRRPDAFAAERRRAAPYTRLDKTSASMFPLVRATFSNPLRSRQRRFESCRGHWSEA